MGFIKKLIKYYSKNTEAIIVFIIFLNSLLQFETINATLLIINVHRFRDVPKIKSKQRKCRWKALKKFTTDKNVIKDESDIHFTQVEV